jgi:hypothetical protein
MIQTILPDVMAHWEQFKVAATIVGFFMACVGFWALGSKIFRFVNTLTDFFECAVPEMSKAVGRIQTALQDMARSIERLGAELKEMKDDFHRHEIDDARIQGQLMEALSVKKDSE